VKALFIFLTGVLILVNAFFVIAEYSLVRSRRAKVESDVEDGLRGSKLALNQLDHINEYISA
jgi:CBS domain containing-hemolysin-like protein